MRVTGRQGDPDLATVYTAELDDGSPLEFVESVQPPFGRDEKWVLIVSTLKGCPVRCPICDAGRYYSGRLSAGEILFQIHAMIYDRYPDGRIGAPKFKVQFARMGDPAFNPSVLEVLEELPLLYDAPGLMPSISTIAPVGCDGFLQGLLEVKDRLYSGGRFQMQFSIHSSSEKARRELVPCETLTFDEMSRWGRRFFSPGDRKITLNFAAVRGYPVDPAVIAGIFPIEYFMIKLTPVNPTSSSRRSGLCGMIDPGRPESAEDLVRGFRDRGFDTILSIGETRENQIGSNCGMYLGLPHGAEISQGLVQSRATVP